MNLFIDESVSQAIVDRLQLDGHSLLVMRQIAPGAPDNEVLKRAVSASSVLLTEDKDFGELVYQSGQAHTGVVLIRLAGLPRQQRASLVSQCIQDREAELPNAFTVISRGGIRIRKSTPPGP